MTIITGIGYPLLITGISQSVFPQKANGSLIYKDGLKVGSKFIGQNFDSTIYFSSRPSAINYDPLPSGGSNYGLSNPKLLKLFIERKNKFLAYNRLDSLTFVPSEMLFASASGLDPHISAEAAKLQVDRIAKARNFDNIKKQKLIRCIETMTEPPQFLCLGEERVNVLLLNLELDEL